MDQKKSRGNFSGKVGFVLASASSAVGLGNLWRFPYLAAEYGGGTFLFVYIIIAVSFGFALMVTEVSIGRKTGKSATVAFKELDKRFGWVGVLAFIIPAIIVPYYGVIGGWVTKYCGVYISGQNMAAAEDGFFGAFSGSTWEPIICMLIFDAITAIVVILGVQKGIEKAAVILMPVLIALCVIVAIYGCMQPGALDGVLYYFKPDFKRMSGKTVLAALGQLFYSMSLAMGIMVTYGSYMKKEDDIESSVRWIDFFDTLVAFLAGLIIVPSFFVYSVGNPDKMNAGVGLMFITLPKVFATMKAGRIIGAMFFILTFFAALTSAISLMETLVSVFIDRFGMSRIKASIISFIYILAMGIPSTLGFGIWSDVKILGMDILSFFDFVSNSVLMPICAFFTAILAGFILKPEAILAETEEAGNKFHSKKYYSFLIKWVCPVGIIAILISSVLSGIGIFTL